MFFKRKLTIWMFIIILLLLSIVAIMLVKGLNTLEKKHEEEIRRVISNIGAVVIKIEKISPQYTPFADDFNKSNIIYKITYVKYNTEHTAWYRGVNVVNNIHAKNPTALEGGYAEKWIIPTESK